MIQARNISVKEFAPLDAIKYTSRK